MTLDTSKSKSELIAELRLLQVELANERAARFLQHASHRQVKFAELLDASPYPASIIDTQFIYQAVNSAYETYHGIKTDQMVGTALVDQLPAETFEHIKPLLDRCLQGENVVYDMWFDFPVMGRRYMNIGYHPRRDKQGKVIGILHISRDITEHVEADKERAAELRRTNALLILEIEERKRTEEEIRTAHRRLDSTFKFLATVMSAMPIPLFYKDREGRYLGVNDAFADLMGHTPEYYVGKTVMELWPDEYAAVYHEKDLELMRHPRRQVYEFKVLDKNGAVHSAIWSKQVFRDESGQVAGIVGAFQDITERVAMEEALRQAEEEKTIILNCASELIVYHDLDLRMRWANQAAAASVNKSVEDLAGRLCHEVWNQRSEPCTGCPVLLARETGRPEETLMASTNGQWWNVKGYPVKNTEGKVVGLVEFCLDVTKRKQAEDELQIEKSRLEHILCGTNAGTWELNVQTGEKIINERWAEMVGFTREELLPTTFGTWVDFCHPDDLQRSNILLGKHFKGELEYYECEVRMRHRNGNWVWVLDRGKVSSWTDDGKPLIMSGTHQDITQRKHAEQALHEALSRLSFHVNNSPLAVIEWAGGTRIKTWSKRAEAIFGWSADEVLDKNWGDFPFVHPDDEAIVAKQVSRLFDGSDSFNMSKNRNLRKDGSVVHCQWYNSPLRDEKGNMLAILSQVADISELAETMADLRLAKDAAEAANIAKNEFLANMSHEIRTPLNGIQGMLSLLQTTPLNEEQEDYIQTAKQSSCRLANLLSDILDLSRIESGKMSIREDDFKLADVLSTTEQLYMPTAKEKNLLFCVHSNPVIPSIIRGDTVRVQQILCNLVGNAIKFTNTGLVEVDTRLLPDRNRDECRVLFSVTDTGIGISDDMLKILFKPFAQVSQGFSRNYQGAGIGLSICKRLVDLMGGSMAIESEPNRGTTVSFVIPFGIAKSAVEAKAPDRLQRANVRKLSILYAEDDPVNRLCAARLADKLGHRTVAVNDGLQALNALKNGKFDIVLMDVQMPIMDGIEATRRIRSGEAGDDNANIPIIALTAYNAPSDMKTFLNSGMDGVLAKPVTMETLQDTLLDAAKALEK